VRPALLQGEQAPLRQASVADTAVVRATTALGLECAHTHPDPGVEANEQAADFRRAEIPRETSKDRIEVLEDRVDVSPLLTTGRESDLVLESVEGLPLPREWYRARRVVCVPHVAVAPGLERLIEVVEDQVCQPR